MINLTLDGAEENTAEEKAPAAAAEKDLNT